MTFATPEIVLTSTLTFAGVRVSTLAFACVVLVPIVPMTVAIVMPAAIALVVASCSFAWRHSLTFAWVALTFAWVAVSSTIADERLK
jgi:hypothetical protein